MRVTTADRDVSVSRLISAASGADLVTLESEKVHLLCVATFIHVPLCRCLTQSTQDIGLFGNTLLRHTQIAEGIQHRQLA